MVMKEEKISGKLKTLGELLGEVTIFFFLQSKINYSFFLFLYLQKKDSSELSEEKICADQLMLHQLPQLNEKNTHKKFNNYY